jgi:hypothetical protein
MNSGAESSPLLHGVAATPLASADQAGQPDLADDKLVVTNCNDSGPGSLREAFANAVDRTTIALDQLTCSSITLTTGALTDSYATTNVTIVGGKDPITINGGMNDRVILHYGYGTLSLRNVTITNGSAPIGGCVFSYGSVYAANTTVTSCHASSKGYVPAYGGAVYAQGSVSLFSSVVSNSTAYSEQGHVAGGGVFAYQVALEANSTITGNTATGNARNYSHGGGIFARRTNDTLVSVVVNYSTVSYNRADNGGGIFATALYLQRSTIDNNTAIDYGGGIFAAFTTGADSKCLETTISTNHAGYEGGGMVLSPGNTILFDSCTVAKNDAVSVAGGLYLNGSSHQLHNTIVMDNTLSMPAGAADVDGGPDATIEGFNNFIRNSALALPGDTIYAPDSLLGPLQYNGGFTRTHALLPGSPAIDHGYAVNFSVDQRGYGYPRVFGPAADIGAVEYSDVIFASGFFY